MIFEALQAKFGDSLLLTIPKKGGGSALMLIDGGPPTVFEKFVAPKLKTLSTPGTPLLIDAVMVSHIDDDHIVGVLKLFDAIPEAITNNQLAPYRIDQLIFNSFDALSGGRAKQLEHDGEITAALGGAPVLGKLSASAQEVLASYPHGRDLAHATVSQNVALNLSQGGQPLVAGQAAPFCIGKAKFTIVGPMKAEIDALHKKWDAWQATQAPKDKASLVAYVDTSVPNLSSIVAMVEYGDKKVLLTGDARGDKTLLGLEAAGFLPKNGTMEVDILKLPHHGSTRNVDKDYFTRIRAKHYVASGDGTYGNPDRQTLELIRAARPDDDYALHLTYDAAHIDATHQADQKKKKKPFDPVKDTISGLIADLRGNGVKVFEGPVKIDLS
jgi:beta-lactamase superfamily II metal-dependent hydrolase